RRTRVAIVDERMVGKKKWLKVTVAAPPPAPTFGDIMAENAKKKAAATATDATPDPAAAGNSTVASMPEIWISADAVNEVRLLEHPKTVPADITKWIDVDLGGARDPDADGDLPGVGQGLGDHDEEPAVRGQAVLREQGAVVDLLPVAQRDSRRVLARSLRRVEV